MERITAVVGNPDLLGEKPTGPNNLSPQLLDFLALLLNLLFPQGESPQVSEETVAENGEPPLTPSDQNQEPEKGPSEAMVFPPVFSIVGDNSTLLERTEPDFQTDPPPNPSFKTNFELPWGKAEETIPSSLPKTENTSKPFTNLQASSPKGYFLKPELFLGLKGESHSEKPLVLPKGLIASEKKEQTLAPEARVSWEIQNVSSRAGIKNPSRLQEPLPRVPHEEVLSSVSKELGGSPLKPQRKELGFYQKHKEVSPKDIYEKQEFSLEKELFLKEPALKREASQKPVWQPPHFSPQHGHLENPASLQLAPATQDVSARSPMELPHLVKEMVLEVHPSGVRKARIKLEPPELGEMEVDVRVHHREVSLFLRVEKSEAAHHLHLHLPQLKEALQDLGLQLSDFQITYFGSGEGWNLSGENSQRGGSEERNRARLEPLGSSPEAQEEADSFPGWTPGRLNLVV